MTGTFKFRFLCILLLTGISAYFAIPGARKPGFGKDGVFAGREVKLGLDLQGGVEMTLVVDPTGEDRRPKTGTDGKIVRESRKIEELTDKVREVIEKRINIRGLKEPIIRRQGSDKVLIQLPGIDEQEVARVRALLERAGRLELRIVADESVMDDFHGPPNAPAGFEWLPVREGGREGGRKHILCSQIVTVTGDDIEDARAEVDYDFRRVTHGAQDRVPWMILFQLSDFGGNKFSQLTAKNLHKKLAIVLDGVVQSAPEIQSVIVDHGQITGSYGEEEAKGLATTLKSGSLPCRVQIEGQGAVSYINPTLGADSIRNGAIACLLSFVAVALFMMVYYRGSGVVSVIALVLNLLYLVAAMALFGATLTLPGIAGLILTMGMAVDGNILIYERVREEREKGKTAAQAFEAGHERAFVTIMDSNLTTLAAGIILYLFGTGPIQGFAVTMSVGILTTLFTVLFCSKVFLRWALTAGLMKDFRMMRLFGKTAIPFTRVFRLCGALSLAAVLVGIAAMAVRGGENFGPDFRGGTVVQPRFTSEIEAADVRAALEKLTVADADGRPLKKYGDLAVISVPPPEEGQGLGRSIFNVFRVAHSKSREQQIRTGEMYPGLFVETIESEQQDRSKDPFHHGLRLSFVPARPASREAVQKVVESALEGVPGEKPQVEVAAKPGPNHMPPAVTVRLTAAQAERRSAVEAALRGDAVGIVGSLRDDVLARFGPQLTRLPFENERPGSANPRSPFAGGRMIAVNLQQPAAPSAVEGVVRGVLGDPKDTFEVAALGAAPDGTATSFDLTFSAAAWSRYDDVVKAFHGASEQTPPAVVLSRGPFQKEASIGAAVSSELQDKAIIATLLSWAVIIVYLAVRFKSWMFGIAAVVALIHDVTISLGAVALCGMLVPKSWGLNFEFSLQTVAAALTIIGYSVNDTIVVFDRIRENANQMRREPLRNIIDLSTNQTISRTVLTSLTVFLVVVLLYIVTMRSTSGIAEFAFPMIVGVVVGTYSSVYIAAPILLFGRREEASPKPQTPAAVA